jgi:hypothetical protein
MPLHGVSLLSLNLSLYPSGNLSPWNDPPLPQQLAARKEHLDAKIHQLSQSDAAAGHLELSLSCSVLDMEEAQVRLYLLNVCVSISPSVRLCGCVVT